MRLELPLWAADHDPGGGSLPRSQYVELDEFQTLAIAVRQSDLSGLSVEASKPVFVSISLSPKLVTPTAGPIETESKPPERNNSVQNERIPVDARSSVSEPVQYRTSPSPNVGRTVSASRDPIVSGLSEADGINMAVVVQLSSVGRLGLTYVLVPTADSRQFYRVAGTRHSSAHLAIRYCTTGNNNHHYRTQCDTEWLSVKFVWRKTQITDV